MSTSYSLLLALTSEDAVVPPPTGTTNYALLLALTSEVGTPAPPRGLGLPSGRRIKRSELERRLKEQRDNTFGRRRFDELVAAQEAAREAASEAANKAQRKALAKAAKAAEEVREEVELSETVPDLAPLTLALDAAASATRVKDALLSARHAVEIANAIVAHIRRAEQEDEDEALTLLLLQ